MDQPEPIPTGQESSFPINADRATIGAIGNYNNVNMLTRRELSWPIMVGSPPPLASAFQPRSAIVEKIGQVDGTVVLQQVSGQVLSGTGGIGKTQIAAGIFRSSDAYLRVWVNAESRDAALTGLAEAAVMLDLADRGGDPDQLARCFLGYLSGREVSWLVVLDNLSEVRDLDGLWPPSGGHVIVTTRRRDAAVSGQGRIVVDVGVYTDQEALDYLHERISPSLSQLPADVFLEDKDLIGDLGSLPLALAQAAAVIIDQGITCAEYRSWFADRALALGELFPADAHADGYARTVATTWALAIEAADRIEPLGLARPMAVVMALLDPTGVPENVLRSQAICDRLSEDTRGLVTPLLARKALRALNRLSLIEHDLEVDNPRAVRMHNLTGRAILETLLPQETAASARSAANGLLEIWPAIEKDPLVAESLRSNTAVLAAACPDGVWDSDGIGTHPVLFRSGNSLSEAGLIGPSIQYHQQLVLEAEDRLGADHTDAVATRNNLAYAYMIAGRLSEAIQIFEQTVKDSTRVLGPDHPETFISRNNLAGAYDSAGLLSEAIPRFEKILKDSIRVLGADHPNTFSSRNNLAGAYKSAGRLGEAIPQLERILQDLIRVLGTDHPNTLSTRDNLAGAYMFVGRIDTAITQFEEILEDRERVLGADHPDTLGSRNNLAGAYDSAGRLDEAIPLYEKNLSDSMRVLGSGHSNTLGSRNNLALAYYSAGRLDEAITQFKEIIDDSMRVLGADHPNTLSASNNLALAYGSAGRLDEAITQFEGILEDRMRVFGADHPNTLISRNNLACAYESAGRLDEAITQFEEILEDRERVLGADHPDTLVSRNNLADSYRSAGRLDEAIIRFNEIINDSMRVLGTDHPNTLSASHNLAIAYYSAGRLDEAIPLFEETLKGRERVLGADHPDTLIVRNNLDYAYGLRGF